MEYGHYAGGKGGMERANFRQSSFLGTPLSPEGLRKRASNYQPSLTDECRVTYAILGLMNEGIELREIASRMVERFPDQFATQIEALTRIANLSQKYSR